MGRPKKCKHIGFVTVTTVVLEHTTHNVYDQQPLGEYQLRKTGSGKLLFKCSECEKAWFFTASAIKPKWAYKILNELVKSGRPIDLEYL